MQFIKTHWFGLSISIFVIYFLSVFLVVMISPHQDEQKRGFVPCTESMAEKLHECEAQKMCVLKVVTENTFCDIGVINEGFRLWITGKQSNFWSNYMFSPQAKNIEENDRELEEFLKENPDFGSQMNELSILREELEAKLSSPMSVVFEGGGDFIVEESMDEELDLVDSEDIVDNNGEDDE